MVTLVAWYVEVLFIERSVGAMIELLICQRQCAVSSCGLWLRRQATLVKPISQFRQRCSFDGVFAVQSIFDYAKAKSCGAKPMLEKWDY